MPRRKSKAFRFNMNSSSEERTPAVQENWISPSTKKRRQMGEDPYDTQFPCSLKIRITQSRPNFKLGEFTVRLSDVNESITSEFIFLRFGVDLPHCLLCWENTDEENEMKVKFYDAVCDVPFKVLESLKIKAFDVALEPCILQSGEVTFHVCINPSRCLLLSYAAQPYVSHTRRNVNTILKYFQAVDYEVYHSDFIEDEGHVDKIYKSIQNYYDPDKKYSLLCHPYLIPKLREYQNQAVNWMLKRENAIEMMHTSCLHILYDELNLYDGSKIYVHKYGGFFVNERYKSEVPCRGGILSDEMGLGKTVEVLACILLNPRNKSSDKSENQIPEHGSSEPHTENRCLFPLVNDKAKLSLEDLNPKIAELNNKNESVGENERINSIYFECVCGESYSEISDKTNVTCEKCGLIQHAECVLHEYNDRSDHYICPYCCVNLRNPVQSGATLIVSPSAILYQWDREIHNHIKDNFLKVFTYLGVSQQKFIDPSDLAGYDIVLTSYETFRKEFKHVNVPHGTSRRLLRYPKKFTFIPSPLSAVEWWRICLDEAQMVEGVSSHTAKMSLHLHAVNRWCVTGTPIQKSVEDLYGLLLFLGYDPYHEQVWWKEVLLKPFANGKPANIVCVLNQILWRTAKKNVINQIGIPHQECVVHTTYLTRVEKLFYRNQRDGCRIDFTELLKKYGCAGASLRSMDKQLVSKIMLPLKKLQQACCHFQLVRDHFVDVQRSKMTIEELLIHLLRNATNDCEEAHRKLIMAMNGLAGMYAIKKDFKSSCDIYKKVLKSVEENKVNIRTDILQQVHTLHNFSRILVEGNLNDGVCTASDTLVSEDIDLNPEKMTERKEELCQSFLTRYLPAVENSKINVANSASEIEKILSSFKSGFHSAWYCRVFHSLAENEKVAFITRVKDTLNDAPGVTFGGPSIVNCFHHPSGFLYVLMKKEHELMESRQSLLTAIHKMPSRPSSSDLDSAVDCHLRDRRNFLARCVYCKADDNFQRYESTLFRFEEANNREPSDVDEICFGRLKKGTHAASDLEIILRTFENYCHHQMDLCEYVEDGVTSLKLLDAMKKEFKYLRRYWINIMSYVGAVDEIRQAMTPLRVFNGKDVVPHRYKESHLVLPSAVQSTFIQFQSDVVCAEAEMKKKMGQLFYLQNLKNSKKENTFDDPCPVCQTKLQSAFSVLLCGHAFCLECVQALKKFTMDAGRRGVPCPVCREMTATTDIYCVQNDSTSSDDGFIVKGYFSSKIFSVVKCLLTIQRDDPLAKSLVFSTWKDFLHILEFALKENDIPYISLCDRKDFQLKLENFKLDPCLNVLLLPMNVGANGLNIIEATHVLIAEPLLDNSKVLQAIGRIHRIGQTKPTVVHRFVVMGTIEEKMYEIVESKSPEDEHENMESSLTVDDLRSFFDET